MKAEEKTPIEELREDIQKSEILSDATKTILSAFDWDRLLEKEQQYANQKVLEALESRRIKDFDDGYNEGYDDGVSGNKHRYKHK